MTMDRPPIHPLVAHCMSAYDIPESALAHDGGVAMTVDAVYSLGWCRWRRDGWA